MPPSAAPSGRPREAAAGVVARGPAGPYRATSPSTEATRATVDIRTGALVPNLCFQCGAPTEDRVRIERTLRKGGIPRWLLIALATIVIAGSILLFIEWVCGAMLLGAVTFAFFGMFRYHYVPAAAIDDLRTESTTVTVQVAQCAPCRRHSKLDPTHVDWNESTMTFIVPRAVADEIRGAQ